MIILALIFVHFCINFFRHYVHAIHDLKIIKDSFIVNQLYVNLFDTKHSFYFVLSKFTWIRNFHKSVTLKKLLYI